jgi:hypothetical protein
VLGLRDGFLIHEFVAGRPLRRDDADPLLLRFAVRYLAHLRRRFVVGQSALLEPLVRMIDVNVTEGAGRHWRQKLGDLDRFLPMLSDVPAVAIDGRLLPHECLRTDAGILKTDALDHHDDHFMPGPQDIAWDVAAFGIEFGLPQRTFQDFAEEVARTSGDRDLPARLPFYAVAYVSFRLGYVTLGAEVLDGSPDGARMALLRHRYQRELRSAIMRLDQTPGTRGGAMRSRFTGASFCRAGVTVRN